MHQLHSTFSNVRLLQVIVQRNNRVDCHTCVTWTTLTGVTLYKVNAGTIVHTGMAFTVVNVCFTSVTLEPIVTLASERKIYQNISRTLRPVTSMQK